MYKVIQARIRTTSAPLTIVKCESFTWFVTRYGPVHRRRYKSFRAECMCNKETDLQVIVVEALELVLIEILIM